MKKVYIVLTHSGSFLSRLVKAYTGKDYSHVSISLDENLDTMYSFGRVWAYNPFWGGFVHESPRFGTFKRFNKTTCKILSLSVTDEQYDKIGKIIDSFLNDKNSYRFNMIGLAAVMIDLRVKRKNCFYCAEFVKYVLDSAGVKYDLPEIVKPMDFVSINNLDVIYTGRLVDYHI